MTLQQELTRRLLGDYLLSEDIVQASGLLRQLAKTLVERASQAGLTSCPGRAGGIHRPAASGDELQVDFGNVNIEVPCDGKANFEQQRASTFTTAHSLDLIRSTTKQLAGSRIPNFQTLPWSAHEHVDLAAPHRLDGGVAGHGFGLRGGAQAPATRYR